MARRLVVCADGTWNTKDQQDDGHPAPTNVVKLYEAVSRRPTASDGVAQLAYYHAGVGAHMNAIEKLWHSVAGVLHLHAAEHNVLGGVTGRGIDDNIKACYAWLVEQYQPGDRIYLFGFSRGAYTVRSLAGLIYNCGLLAAHNTELVDQAYELYRDRGRDTSPSSARAAQFRRLHGREVDVTCVGVWDTVGALGVPLPMLRELNDRRYEFHDVRLNRRVGHAYHALAIDEERVPFAPSLWEQDPEAPATQVLEQTWFPGVHCNIGGGYQDCGLSDAAFRWMVARAERAGLEMDHEYLDAVATTGAWNGRLEDSMNAIYRRLGAYSRPIAAGRTAAEAEAGAPDPRHETVHDSAFERWSQVAPAREGPYMPPNLADYLRRFPSAARLPASGAPARPAVAGTGQ